MGRFIAVTQRIFKSYNFLVIVNKISTSNKLLSRTAAVNVGFVKRVGNVIGSDLFWDIGLVDCDPEMIKVKKTMQNLTVLLQQVGFQSPFKQMLRKT